MTEFILLGCITVTFAFIGMLIIFKFDKKGQNKSLTSNHS
jgi:hypothetical protein